MQIPDKPNRFFKDNIYLLFISLLLLAVSIFTGKSPSAESLTNVYTQKLQVQIDHSEKEFEKEINIIFKNTIWYTGYLQFLVWLKCKN